MPLLSSATVLRLIDSMAIVLAQAYLSPLYEAGPVKGQNGRYVHPSIRGYP